MPVARRRWCARCSTTRSASATWRRRCCASHVPTRRTRSPRSSLPSPLEGRRWWLAGIGGAGMSGYALLARAWGAEIGGWDRVRTPYLERLSGVDVVISDEPPDPPAGWEAFVSSAFTGRVEAKSRAELLAELVSLRDSVVVAGAHGKTTTAGMIAFCLARLGRDPAWLIGGDIPQLAGDAGARQGGLLARRGET